MIVQVTQLSAPTDHHEPLQKLIEAEYIPFFQTQGGFAGAEIELTEKTDTIELLLFWHSREDVDRLEQEGVFARAAMVLAIQLPGLRVRQHGFMVGATVPSFA